VESGISSPSPQIRRSVGIVSSPIGWRLHRRSEYNDPAVKPARPLATLLLVGALLLLGAPLVTAVCAGGSACPCPMMGAGEPGRCAGPTLRIEMSCCRTAADEATPTAPAVVAPASDAAAPTADLAARFEAALRPAAPESARAAIAQAERRHELGIFTLHAVFLI
jgi:hypothetical protein